jgi:hypothetical protein
MKRQSPPDRPIPIDTTAALKNMLDIAGGKAKGAPATKREAIMATGMVALLKKLDLQQQAIDLRRERQEGRRSELCLADLVSEAYQRAEERKAERESRRP